MAAIPVTITGVLADKYGRTLQNVTLFGEMVRSDVGVGGGPIVPPEGGTPGEPPLGIWGPTDPRPTPPIVIPGPIPPQPPESGTKPPPAGDSGWGYYDGRWGYFPGPGEAQPKA